MASAAEVATTALSAVVLPPEGALTVPDDAPTRHSWATLHHLYGQALAESKAAWNDRAAMMTKASACSQDVLTLQREVAAQADDLCSTREESARLRRERLSNTAEISQLKATVADLEEALARAYAKDSSDESGRTAPSITFASHETTSEHVLSTVHHSRARIALSEFQSVWRQLVATMTGTTPLKDELQEHGMAVDLGESTTVDTLLDCFQSVAGHIGDYVREQRAAVDASRSQSAAFTAMSVTSSERVSELTKSNATLRRTCNTLDLQMREMLEELDAQRATSDATMATALDDRFNALVAQIPLDLLRKVRTGDLNASATADDRPHTWADALASVGDLGSCCLALEQALLCERDHHLTEVGELREQFTGLVEEYRKQHHPSHGTSAQHHELDRSAASDVGCQAVTACWDAATQCDTTTRELHSTVALAAERGHTIAALTKEANALRASVQTQGESIDTSRRVLTAIDNWSHSLLARQAPVSRRPIARLRAAGSVVLACVCLVRMRSDETGTRSAQPRDRAYAPFRHRAMRDRIRFVVTTTAHTATRRSPVPASQRHAGSLSPPTTRATSIAQTYEDVVASNMAAVVAEAKKLTKPAAPKLSSEWRLLPAEGSPASPLALEATTAAVPVDDVSDASSLDSASPQVQRCQHSHGGPPQVFIHSASPQRSNDGPATPPRGVTADASTFPVVSPMSAAKVPVSSSPLLGGARVAVRTTSSSHRSHTPPSPPRNGGGVARAHVPCDVSLVSIASHASRCEACRIVKSRIEEEERCASKAASRTSSPPAAAVRRTPEPMHKDLYAHRTVASSSHHSTTRMSGGPGRRPNTPPLAPSGQHLNVSTGRVTPHDDSSDVDVSREILAVITAMDRQVDHALGPQRI